MKESSRSRVEWSGAAILMPETAEGTFSGAYMGEWNSTAGADRVWDFDGGEHNKRHEERTCGGQGSGHAGGNIEGRLEGEQLHLTISTWTHNVQDDGLVCHYWQEDTTSEGVKRREGTAPYSWRAPMWAGYETSETRQAFEVVVPLEGRASFRSSFSAALPAPEGVPAYTYCNISPPEWASGRCEAQGTLTVHVWVDPCISIKRRLAELVDALSQVPPPPEGADEAAVAAWAAGIHPQVSAVLGAARTHLLLCGEDLPVEPWDAVVRAQRMHRDALIAIAREGELSPEGIGTLLGVERQLQLLGVDDNIDLGSIIDPSAAPPPPPGTIEVRVHSPVSLHAWSEDGGHVGWNATTNTSEVTIPGATYEGAPGGEQRIVLPSGFYRISVDELGPGPYLLDVRMNTTESQANESWLVQSVPGRTTTTHYAVVAQDGAAALETFPVHRTSAAGAAAPIGGAAPTGGDARPDDGDAPAAADGSNDARGERRGVPAAGTLALALAASGAALLLARRARR